MRATVSLSAPRQEQFHEGVSPRNALLQQFLSRGWQTDRCPYYTFDIYFITPIKIINFKAITVISALLVFVLR